MIESQDLPLNLFDTKVLLDTSCLDEWYKADYMEGGTYILSIEVYFRFMINHT